jgi:hypothetical protein
MADAGMEKRYEESLKQLVRTIQQVENLAAWLELEKSERKPDAEAGFRWSSSTEQDLRTQVGAFLSQYFDILDELSRKRQTPETNRMRERLQRLHNRFATVSAPKVL